MNTLKPVIKTVNICGRGLLTDYLLKQSKETDCASIAYSKLRNNCTSIELKSSPPVKLIPQNSFKDLDWIRSVSLDGVYISKGIIEGTLPKNITDLYLNNLDTVDASFFSQLINIEELHITNTVLENLEESVLPETITSLTLTGTSINNKNNIIKGSQLERLKSLKRMVFANIKIVDLQSEMLSESIEYISIKHDRTVSDKATYDSGIFSNISNLKTLKLGNVYLENVTSKTLPSGLNSLSFHVKQGIQTVPFDLSELASLRYLLINNESNSFKIGEENFSKNLNSFIIKNGWDDNNEPYSIEIKDNIFKSMTELETIDLTNISSGDYIIDTLPEKLKILNINAEILKLEELKKLSLKVLGLYGTIEELNKSFLTNSLTKLDLTRAKIKAIEEGVFKDLKNITSENKISMGWTEILKNTTNMATKEDIRGYLFGEESEIKLDITFLY